ncbi:hypothetical protein VOLCADRAFT_86033 [Volvox carteri f. nagariensis]|uniref:Cyclic nucleotide-binding domain-containing protein n=1 Tax=Volvox carteri f. nagariensis TaxID=3068 RepID=D8THN5_VOLCA|nr:uncharacterized protein VOLCADRAFT_86033 [Volvox carteri f. nagariensis]EFJ52746.1 hypothetical protein VOLCADRAFT_86033 [Volvox carteri f. nagariensis]|eukprot:XP_002945751.1 hypothetical protein VOLCADRAFT_86033 [Volvox carteri f. nagariensis]
MPTMSWNRVEGFEGNEARLGSRTASEAQPVLPVLTDNEYQYSDYYQPNTSSTDEDWNMFDLQPNSLNKKKRLGVILPDSRFRKIWVNVQLFVVLYIIWVTPVRVGFNKPASGFWFWLEGLIDLFFYTDLVLNFLTAYEHPVTGELITNHRKIAVRYLKTWFVIDLLATFPSDYVVRGIELDPRVRHGTWTCSIMNNCDLVVPSDSAASLVVMLRLLRFFRILWIFKNFNVLSISTVLGRLQDEFYAARWVLSILELLIVLVYLGHLSGCFFYLFSGPQWWTNEEKLLINGGELSTWVFDKMGGYYTVMMPTASAAQPDPTQQNSLQDPSSSQWYTCPEYFTLVQCPKCESLPLRCKSDFGFPYRYITAMYWAYTTMTTVGYGDIYGTTIAEKVWCMITMVIGGFFLSFCFGRMASIVSRLDADKVARGEQLHELSAFMKDVELPRPLARKVLEYNKKQKVRAYDRQAVLSRLPFELRAKILRHLYLPTVARVPLLQSMAEDDVFLTDLCVRLQPTHFSADTFVYMRGENGADVYILLQGELQVLAEPSALLYSIPEGTIFGEGSVLRQLFNQESGKVKRRENVFCKTPCDMLRIPEEDIKDLCEHYPELLRGLRKLDVLRQARTQERLAAIKEQLESSRHSAGATERETSSLLAGKHPGSFSSMPANGNSAGSGSGMVSAAVAARAGGNVGSGAGAAAAAAGGLMAPPAGKATDPLRTHGGPPS